MSCCLFKGEVFSADTACALLARIGEQENMITKLESKLSSQEEIVRDLERQMRALRGAEKEKHHP